MITVFTPTFNRAYRLNKLYDSLIQQTCKQFVWLVIDDGSSDNTEELIGEFIQQKKISIVYIKQQNGGKHSAINKAVTQCETELFVCVDSDDYLTENAIEIILSTHKKNSDEDLLGFYFRKIYSDGTNVAIEYPANIRKVGITELYHKYKFKGDTVIVLKTSKIKEKTFPVYADEKFVTERFWYNEMDEIGPMLLCDEGIYISEYLPDGYTKNAKKLAVKNPYGTATAFLSESVYEYRLVDKAKNYAQYLAFIKLFNLNSSVIEFDGKPNIFVRLLGKLLMNHYVVLYRDESETGQ